MKWLATMDLHMKGILSELKPSPKLVNTSHLYSIKSFYRMRYLHECINDHEYC